MVRDKRQESIDKTAAAVDTAMAKPSVHGVPKVARLSVIQAALDQTYENNMHVVDNLETGKINFAEYRKVLSYARSSVPIMLADCEHKD